MERLRPTRLLPARAIQAIGVVMVIAALLAPHLLIRDRTLSASASVEEGAQALGPLRPAMVVIPEMTTSDGDGETDTAPSTPSTANQSRLAVTQTEITVGQYRRVMGLPIESPGALSGDGTDCGAPLSLEHPITCVTVDDAIAYANRLSQLEGLTPCYGPEPGDRSPKPRCNGFRLPTASEWVYAHNARGPAPPAETDTDLCDFANLGDESARVETADGCQDGHAGPAAVASYRPNAWFLYDMIGNVAELTISEIEGPKPTTAGTATLALGGSWQTNPSEAEMFFSGQGRSRHEFTVSFHFRPIERPELTKDLAKLFDDSKFATTRLRTEGTARGMMRLVESQDESVGTRVGPDVGFRLFRGDDLLAKKGTLSPR